MFTSSLFQINVSVVVSSFVMFISQILSMSIAAFVNRVLPGLTEKFWAFEKWMPLMKTKRTDSLFNIFSKLSRSHGAPDPDALRTNLLNLIQWIWYQWTGVVIFLSFAWGWALNALKMAKIADFRTLFLTNQLTLNAIFQLNEKPGRVEEWHRAKISHSKLPGWLTNSCFVEQTE